MNVRQLGRYLGYAAATSVIIAALYAIYLCAVLFASASGNVKLGVVTAFVSVASLLFSNNKQQIREIKARQFSDKREAYSAFFDFLFEIMNNQGREDPLLNYDATMTKVRLITKKLMIWGSAETINSYNSFMRSSLLAPDSPTAQLKRVESLLLSFREDLGHNDAKLESFGLSKLILKADEHHNLDD